MHHQMIRLRRSPWLVPSMALLIALLAVIDAGRAASQFSAAQDTGDLTLIVRDEDGNRLSQVHLLLFHDADTGATLLHHTQTDNTVNGFGIRLAQPELMQLFVMIQTHEADPAGPAIPLFDLAAGTGERPRPIDTRRGDEILTTPDASDGLALTVLSRPGRRWMRALLAALSITALIGGIWSVRHGRRGVPTRTMKGEHHDWTRR